jgi:alpha-tubulin suppressor-like RCC1 family protein
MYPDDEGHWHACGVTTSGAAYCWGANHRGQLGDGTTTDSTTPIPVAGGLTFAMVNAAGWSSCGVTTSGTAYCWGANDTGQLGDGTNNQRTAPSPVVGGLKFQTVSGEQADGQWAEYSDPALTFGVSSAGVVYCWGSTWEWGTAIPIPISFP